MYRTGLSMGRCRVSYKRSMRDLGLGGGGLGYRGLDN